jgi:hypothetical protein
MCDRKIRLLIVCCIAIFVMACGGGDGNGASEEGQTRATSYVVGPICQGTPLPEAPSYTQTSGVHPLVILELGNEGDYQYGFIDPNAYSLPDGWDGDYVEEVELVVCVDQEEHALVEECPYTFDDGSGTAVLSRYSTEVTFRLLEAQTGREIASDTLFSMPRECQETEEFVEGSEGASVYGQVYEDLENWLRPYVEIP